VTTNEGVLVFNSLGKQFTDILMAHNIKFFIIKRKWYKKILGYRSCKWWKASIASIFYLFMFFSGVAMIFGEDTTEAEKTKVTSTTENSKSEADRSADEQKKKDEEEAARLAEKSDSKKRQQNNKQPKMFFTQTVQKYVKQEQLQFMKVNLVILQN
jgi:hypothetical protein